VEVLKRQWKASLCITGVYLGGTLLGGRGILNPYVLAVFCQAMYGLAIARGIPDFQALRMSQALIHREKKQQGSLRQPADRGLDQRAGHPGGHGRAVDWPLHFR
jgi:hypothetical protein